MYCYRLRLRHRKSCCQRLASEDGLVVVVDRNENEGNETVKIITGQSGTAIFIKCDVGVEDEIKQAVDKTTDKWVG